MPVRWILKIHLVTFQQNGQSQRRV